MIQLTPSPGTPKSSKTISTRADTPWKTSVHLGYDGGMDEAAFTKKWSSTYDISHAGIGTAFLISGQDNGKVKVTKCVVKPTTTVDANILDVIISDPDMNVTYHRDFKIVPIGKAYQIDDVVEWD